MKLLTAKQETFAAALARGESASAAYKIAFGRADRAHASRLQRRDIIARRVRELLEVARRVEADSTASALAAAEASKLKIVKALAAIGFSNIADFLDKDGLITAAQFRRLPRETLAAVVGYEVVRTRRNGRVVERIKLKLTDRHAALRTLGQMQQMFAPALQVAATLNYVFTDSDSEL